MDLVCKNGIGAEYRITCKGIGVYPPLELSQSTISFRATAVADISIATFKVMNNHTDGNEFTHEVPRIGQGPVAKVGPTTFEFVVPPGAPVSISPAVGVVRPGEVISNLINLIDTHCFIAHLHSLGRHRLQCCNLSKSCNKLVNFIKSHEVC